MRSNSAHSTGSITGSTSCLGGDLRNDRARGRCWSSSILRSNMAINHWFPLLNNGPTHNVADAFYCQWLWHAITILADRNVTCGLDDPFGMRSFGNVQTQSVKEIIGSTALNSLRSNLLSGIRCKTCNLYSRVDDTNRSLLTPSPYPKRAVIESTIRCNIRCRNAVTVQVPQSIFLDKSRGIGYRRVDECESGSSDKATRGSGE